MWTSDKESLCNSHDTIKYWATDVKKAIKKAQKNNDYSSIPVLLETVDNIIKESRIAKKKGQALENRCRLYRNNIEKMGFKRIEK